MRHDKGGHSHGFVDALGAAYLLQFPPLRLFVFGAILYALCGGR